MLSIKQLFSLMALLLLSLSFSEQAGAKTLFACEVVKTASIQRQQGEWKIFALKPRTSFLKPRKRFVIALLPDKRISETSAKEIFSSNGATCVARNDVDFTFCNSPGGDALVFDLRRRSGSISEALMEEATVSVFECQPF